MRRVLLALLLVTGPLAGCLDGEAAIQLEDPDLPTGLLLAYEVTQDGQTSRETFLVHNGTSDGFDLLAWNLSRPGFQSPLLHLDGDLVPRSPNWTGLFEYPLAPGDRTDGIVGGSAAELSWSKTEHEGPLGTDRALEAKAVTDDGETVGRFRLAGEASPVLTYVEVDTADGTNETWELVDSRLERGWNSPPSWSLGDWWTYEGSFRSEEGRSQIVYTGNTTTRQAAQYQLNPREVEDRVLMLPLKGFRQSDIAPQSGFVTSLMSSFWDWPLADGKTWTGSTTTADGSATYGAVSQLTERMELPDGTVSVGFTIQAGVQGASEPFATYRYSPRAEHLTEWRMTQVGTEDPALNFTMQDWGHSFHGTMEIPQRTLAASIPAGNASILSGPVEVEREFEVPEQANRVQIGSQSFAVHRADADPEFEFQLVNPNGTVRYERNETAFDGRRMSLSDVVDAEPGTWRWRVSMSEDVSMIATVYANWFTTETVDFR